MFSLRRTRMLTGAIALGAVFALGACSSTGGAQSTDTGAAPSERMTIAMVTHSPDGDPFFDVIIKGAEEAAAKDNVDLKYSSSPDIPTQAGFIQNAIDSKVDAIAVTMPDPGALSPTVQKAVAAGIPVIVINAGDRDWQKSGALAFYGEPEVLAGEYAGSKLNEMGAKHALCVLHSQGQVQLEDRCDGMASTFTGTTERLYAQGSDLPQYVSTVNAKLQQDPSIDAVVTLSASLGVAVAQQNEQTGNKAAVATYAFTPDLLPMLQDGRVAFTIDQQPYLQGYMAVDQLWLYRHNKSVLGANLSVPTGPVVIDQDNIDDVLQGVQDGLR